MLRKGTQALSTSFNHAMAEVMMLKEAYRASRLKTSACSGCRVRSLGGEESSVLNLWTSYHGCLPFFLPWTASPAQGDHPCASNQFAQVVMHLQYLLGLCQRHCCPRLRMLLAVIKLGVVEDMIVRCDVLSMDTAYDGSSMNIERLNRTNGKPPLCPLCHLSSQGMKGRTDAQGQITKQEL